MEQHVNHIFPYWIQFRIRSLGFVLEPLLEPLLHRVFVLRQMSSLSTSEAKSLPFNLQLKERQTRIALFMKLFNPR